MMALTAVSVFLFSFYPPFLDFFSLLFLETLVF